MLDTEGNILSINDNVFEYDELNRLVKSEIVRLGETDYRVKVKKAFGTSMLRQSVKGNVWDEEADLNADGLVDGYDHVKACQDWRDKYDREAFTYDFNGNRTKLIQNKGEYKYFYGAQNKLIKVEKSGKILIEFEYDNNGNTVKKTEHNEDNTKTVYNYKYDFNNRLTEVLKNSAIAARYIYDNAGMRLYKEENNKRTYYFRNGQSVNYEVEIDETKNEVNENTYIMSGELIAGRVERKNAGTETVVYYHLDHLNSTKMITDQSGTVVLTYEYRAFGTELDKVGTDENRFSYIGREFDEEINLYYFNARYYDATLGRFINVDPIQDGLNWYVYCNNNPLSFKDPTGLTYYNEQYDISYEIKDADNFNIIKKSYDKVYKWSDPGYIKLFEFSKLMKNLKELYLNYTKDACFYRAYIMGRLLNNYGYNVGYVEVDFEDKELSEYSFHVAPYVELSDGSKYIIDPMYSSDPLLIEDWLKNQNLIDVKGNKKDGFDLIIKFDISKIKELPNSDEDVRNSPDFQDHPPTIERAFYLMKRFIEKNIEEKR